MTKNVFFIQVIIYPAKFVILTCFLEKFHQTAELTNPSSLWDYLGCLTKFLFHCLVIDQQLLVLEGTKISSKDFNFFVSFTSLIWAPLSNKAILPIIQTFSFVRKVFTLLIRA